VVLNVINPLAPKDLLFRGQCGDMLGVVVLKSLDFIVHGCLSACVTNSLRKVSGFLFIPDCYKKGMVLGRKFFISYIINKRVGCTWEMWQKRRAKQWGYHVEGIGNILTKTHWGVFRGVFYSMPSAEWSFKCGFIDGGEGHNIVGRRG